MPLLHHTPGRTADPSKRRLPTPLQRSLELLAEHREPVSVQERRDLIRSLFHEGDLRAPYMNRFMSLMMLSVLIAVLGVLADSTAVVIGAMLVAPLMDPVLGVAVALVMDWRERVCTSGLIVLIGSAAAVGVAVLVSFLLPGDPERLSGELLARTSPTLIDLAVALVAGSAGAYAKLRRQAADAIVGVAVAVALVPPLAVVGTTLELGRYQLALGAFLLFLANVSGIITAAATTFVILGLVPSSRLRTTRSHVAQSLRLAVLGTVAIVAPLQLVDAWRPEPTLDSDPEELVAEAVAAWRNDVSIIAMDLQMGEPESTPVLGLAVAAGSDTTEPLGVEDLAADLASIIGEPIRVELTTVESRVESAVGDEDDAEQD